MHNAIKLLTSGKRRRLTPLPIAIGALVSSTILILLLQIIIVVESSDNSETDDKWNITTLERLRTELFINYDKNLQPLHKGKPSEIKMGITVNYIDIDEFNGKMTVHGWINAQWIDDNRQWNSTEYNITTIHVRPEEIWKPDLSLFNSAGEPGSEYIGDTQLLLTDGGEYIWVPPAVFTVYCNLNLQMWPFDTQLCSLKIGSWSMTVFNERHLLQKGTIDIQDLVQSTEWEIINTYASYHQKDYHNYAEFTFELERRSSMYTTVIFTPASCIVLLALSTFWLPPQMGEKILLNGIIIVVIAAFLMYFAQLLPVMAEKTPYIVLFYSSSLLLVSISTIIAVLVLYLSTAKHKRRVPDLLKNLLNGRLGKILCLSQFSLEFEPNSLLNNGTKELTEHVYDTPDNESPDPLSVNPVASPSTRAIQFDWILLATAVDRICFLCFCMIFLILAITYSV